jgi:hypothetical protein
VAPSTWWAAKAVLIMVLTMDYHISSPECRHPVSMHFPQHIGRVLNLFSGRALIYNITAQMGALSSTTNSNQGTNHVDFCYNHRETTKSTGVLTYTVKTSCAHRCRLLELVINVVGLVGYSCGFQQFALSNFCVCAPVCWTRAGWCLDWIAWRPFT